MFKNLNNRFFLITGLIIIAAISRLVEHPANFSPIMAIAIFAAATFDNKRIAILIPFLAMGLSDLFLGFHLISFFVYLSFALALLIGFYIKNRIKLANIILATLTGSIAFFVITNYGAWLTDPIYQPLSLESLSRCYYLAIPFFRNALLGDFTYITVLFGAYALAGKYLPVFSKR